MNATPLPVYSVSVFQLAEETQINLKTDGQTNNHDDRPSEKFICVVLSLLLLMVMMNMTMIIMMLKQRCGSVVRTDLLLHLVQQWRFLSFTVSFTFLRNILFASDSTMNSLTTGSVRITLGRVRVTIVAFEEQCFPYSRCTFVALVIQYAMCMRHIFICSLSGSIVFFHISQESHDFRENSIEYIKRVFFYTTFV